MLRRPAGDFNPVEPPIREESDRSGVRRPERILSALCSSERVSDDGIQRMHPQLLLTIGTGGDVGHARPIRRNRDRSPVSHVGPRQPGGRRKLSLTPIGTRAQPEH